MTALHLLAIFCVAVSFLTALFRIKKMEQGRFVTKMIASLTFCLIAFLAARERTASLNMQTVMMLAALVLGMVGDLLLGLDYFVSESNKTFFFLVGGTPFFFGHILYIALLLSYGNLHPWLLLILPLVPAFLFLLQQMGLVDLGRSLIPLMLYGLVLGGMMISTLNLAMRGGALGRMMVFPGVLFTVSDLSLFLGRFAHERLRRVVPGLSFTVMLPYYAAQALFALSVAYL